MPKRLALVAPQRVGNKNTHVINQVASADPVRERRRVKGATLSKDVREYKWLPTVSEADESTETIDPEEGHAKTLKISMIVCGPDAKLDELQVVEVTTTDFRMETKVAPVGLLVPGRIYQARVNIELPEVVSTIRLLRGDGPVTLVGKEFVEELDPDDGGEEEQLDEEEGEEEAEAEAEEEEISTRPKVGNKKRKRPDTSESVANGKKTGKKQKVDPQAREEEDEDNEEDEDDEDMDESDEDENSGEDESLRKPKVAGKKALKNRTLNKKDPGTRKVANKALKKAQKTKA